MRRTRIRKVIRDGALLAVVSLIVFEGALRLFDFVSPSYIYYDDTYNRFRGRPHAADWNFRLNSLGFKDLEFASETDAYRVVALGDSFAFGVVPYEANFLTLFEQALARRYPGAEVLNMGIPAIGPKHYLDVLVREGLAFDPDAVLVAFFVGNDFSESLAGRRDLLSYSYVVSLARFVLEVRPEYAGHRVAHGARRYRDDTETFSKQKHLEIEAERSYLFRTDDERLASEGAAALEHLTRIRDLCRRRGIDLHVLLIPDELQVDRRLQADVRRTHFPDVPDPVWDWDRPNRWLRVELERLEIHFLDLLDDFRERSARQPLYRPRDTHWNTAGNRLAADLLADHFGRNDRR